MGNIFNPEPVKDIDNYCKVVGFILIGLGVLHLILAGLLDGMWGFLLITIGLISLVYRSKKMILVFGSALVIVGILNIITSVISEISYFWLIFGFLQIAWGFGELLKYSKTKENPKYKKKGVRKSISQNENIMNIWAKVSSILVILLIIWMFLYFDIVVFLIYFVIISFIYVPIFFYAFANDISNLFIDIWAKIVSIVMPLTFIYTFFIDTSYLADAFYNIPVIILTIPLYYYAWIEKRKKKNDKK